MNYRLIKLTLLLGAAMTAVFGQSSEVEFYDTTGTTPTAKFGWQGSVDEGNFYIETPGDNTPVTIQKGNLNVDGSVSATSFSGDGSGLTGINATGPTATEVADQLKSDQTFLDSLKGPQGIQGEKGDTGDTGPAGTTDWNGITGKPTTYPPSTHNHNSDYVRVGSSDYTSISPVNNGDAVFCQSGSTCNDYGSALSLNTISQAGMVVENHSSTGDQRAAVFRIDDINANLAYRNSSGVKYAGYFNGQVFILDGCTGCNVAPSDSTLKKNIKTMSDPLLKIKNLRGVSFNWKDSTQKSEKDFGVIAQEVKEVIPDAVQSHDGKLRVNYNSMIALLIEAVKDQQQIIQSQQDQINQLKTLFDEKISAK